MSYKYKILQDKPLAFYMLEEVRSGDASNYNNVLSQFSTYQDLKDNGVSYATLSGMPVWDSSGNEFNGYATDASDHELMPIISGAVRGTEVKPITKLYYPVEGIANKEYSDDEFTIEVWASLPNITTSQIPIVADTLNSIGLFYENGTICFSVQNQSIYATIDASEALYIVATFTSNSLNLYIDGKNVASKVLNDFIFTNESSSFISGEAQETFVIDGLAFYKKALTQAQIISHYNAGNIETPTSQIVYPDNGTLFSMNIKKVRNAYEYSYPKSSPWRNFADENVKISEDQSYIYIEKNENALSKTFTFTDSITVPNYMGLTSSQIYWEGSSYGILVEASIDNVNWVECQNAMPLPFFNKNENQFEDLLYLKVTVFSSDVSKYLPVLKNIKIMFFIDKDFYSDNSGYKIYSDYDYGLPHENHLNLSYCKMDGIKMFNGHGFESDYNENIKTVEMLFTPDGGNNVLISTDSAEYSWDQNGNISSTNIISIHVNNIDVTNDNNISDHFVNSYPHHIVITLEDGSGSNIKFNQNISGTVYGGSNTYSNISLYNEELSEQEIHNHYMLFTDRYSMSVSDIGFNISELDSGIDQTAFHIIEFEPLATNV